MKNNGYKYLAFLSNGWTIACLCVVSGSLTRYVENDPLNFESGCGSFSFDPTSGIGFFSLASFFSAF